MNTSNFSEWIANNPQFSIPGLVIACILAYIFTHQIIARGFIYFSKKSENKVDDILVTHLKPFRLSWFSPLIILYASAVYFPQFQTLITKLSQFFLLWLGLFTLITVLNAVNDIYEQSKNYNGVSIKSYLDLAKIFFFFIAIIFSVTILTGQSPWVLLTGLGALTAVLLLIFQSTLLSLVASIQIAANDLLKEGDWIEVPGFGADGDVVDVSLHSIKVRNFDMTYSVIPTNKIVEVAFKNWRGMQESGGRRIKRSISIDLLSISFCDREMLQKFQNIDLINEIITDKLNILNEYQKNNKSSSDSTLDGPKITNIEVFRNYIVAYLNNRDDIYHDDMTFLVRSLSPGPTGLPIELYVFTRTTEWIRYELIQAEIFDHLVAAAQNFGLRIFQEPTGLDFSRLGS